MKKNYTETELVQLISEIEQEFTKSEKPALVEEVKVQDEPKAEQLEKSEHDYDENDLKQVEELYGSMTKAERDIHYSAIKKTLTSDSAVVPEELDKKPEEVTKSEKEVVVEVKTETEESKLLKSEVETLKQSNEDLKKSLEAVTKILKNFAKPSVPKAKAITEIQYIKKSEETINNPASVDVSKLTKKEITSILCEKIRSGKIEKADKEAINKFYDNGQVNMESIKHLLA